MRIPSWVRDSFLSFLGTAILYVVGTIRTDFKQLVEAVNSLTVQMAVMNRQVSDQKDSLEDHEKRLRRVERR